MSNKTIYTPYFYIIQDTRNGMYYAGARWAQNCHPSELLRANGYKTSSKTVAKLIEQNGLESFIIRKIKIFNCADMAYDYETRFLIKISAATNNKFYNKHNNTRFPFGSAEYKTLMLDIIGAENPFELEWIHEKSKITLLKNYGVDSPLKSSDIKNKAIKTNNERYGGNSPFCSIEVRKKYNENMIKNHGVEWAMQSQKIKDKRELTYLSKYGTNNPLKNIEVHKKTLNTLKAKYNVTHNSNIPEVKEKKRLKEQIKLNRYELNILLEYSEKYNIKLGNGWRQRRDIWIYQKLEELYNIYGPLIGLDQTKDESA